MEFPFFMVDAKPARSPMAWQVSFAYIFDKSMSIRRETSSIMIWLSWLMSAASMLMIAVSEFKR